jgi:TetR/AcrR family transcriptional regulator
MSTRKAPAPATDKRAEPSRIAILRAAERIFAEKGLAGARTDAIARQAGVNKALLYYYFKGKEALFEAVLEHHMKEFNRLGIGVLHGKGTARARLLEYVEMHFDFASERRFFPRLFPQLLMSSGGTVRRLAKRYSVPVVGELVHMIELGIKHGEFRPVDGKQTALSLLGLILHYFLVAQLLRRVANVDPYSKPLLARRKKEILDLVRYGLFRDPEARWS